MKFFRYLIGWCLTIAFLFSIIYLIVILYLNAVLSFYLAVLVLVYFFNLLAGLIIFISTRESHSKLSWFMVILLIPILGPVIFIIFGLRYKGRTNFIEYQKKYQKTFSQQQFDLVTKMPNVSIKAQKILKNQEQISARPILPSSFKLLSGGEQSFEKMFNEMRQAKKFLHIHYYIFKQGEIFEEFKNIIISKAKENVQVRVIVDDFGRWALPWYELDEIKEAGVEIIIWDKVHFPFISYKNNYRTHRKIVIIDGLVVYTGGLNIADEYAHLDPKYGYWVDLQVRIEGPAVRSFSLLYINDWKLMADEELDIDIYAPKVAIKGETYSVMVETGPDNATPIASDTIAKLISTATKTICITTPYFIPNDSLLSSLRIAAMGGVKVKIIIPGLPDKKVVWLATKYFASLLIPYGVEFYLIENQIMHSKMGIFDGEIGYVGTINLDVRSFYSLFEVFNIFSGAAIKDAEDIFNDYLKYARKMDTFTEKKYKRIQIAFIRIFAPLM